MHNGQWTALMREGETMDHARLRGNACGQGIGCCAWMRPHQGRARPTQPPCPHERELMCRMPRTPINGAGGLTWCTSEYRSGHVLPHTGVRGCGGRAPRPCGRVVGMPCKGRHTMCVEAAGGQWCSNLCMCIFPGLPVLHCYYPGNLARALLVDKTSTKAAITIT